MQKLPLEWKWVVIGLHSALYGFAICALERGNWENVTVKTKSGHKLIRFAEAIARCQEWEHMVQFTHSKPLVLTTEQKESIRWLEKAWRNNFEHYIPKFWFIEMHDFPPVAIDVLDVIRFLALKSGNVDLEPDDRHKVDSWTTKGKRILQETQLYKDYLAAIKKAKKKP